MYYIILLKKKKGGWMTESLYLKLAFQSPHK